VYFPKARRYQRAKIRLVRGVHGCGHGNDQKVGAGETARIGRAFEFCGGALAVG
jgi:hypothetical protein